MRGKQRSRFLRPDIELAGCKYARRSGPLVLCCRCGHAKWAKLWRGQSAGAGGHEKARVQAGELGCMAWSLACELADRILIDFADNPYVFNSTCTELTMICGTREEIERPAWNLMVKVNPFPLEFVAEKILGFAVEAVAETVPILGDAISFASEAFDWIWPSEAPANSPCSELGKVRVAADATICREVCRREAGRSFGKFYEDSQWSQGAHQ